MPSDHRPLQILRTFPYKKSGAHSCLQWDGLIAVNYAARAKGIAKFTPMDQALKICPELRLMHVQTLGNA